MADLYGSADVTIRSDDGTKIVDIVTLSALNRLDTCSVITDSTATFFMPTLDVASRSGYVRVTDGTNTMPTMDVAARKGFVQITDGTNLMPTGDSIARPIFEKITDGTNVAGVDAANALYVAGKSAVGAAPSSNPLYIAGIDAGGFKRGILTDSTGAVYVTNVQGALTGLGKVYQFSVSISMATSGVNNPLIFLKNPTGSGKNIYVQKLSVGVDVANVFARFGVYIDPTTTANGTSQTATNGFIGGGFAASAMTLFTGPTVTATGTLMQLYEVGQNSNSLNAIAENLLVIGANHTLLVTGDPSSNGRTAVITLVWAEF